MTPNLPSTVIVEDPNGTCFNQKVVYEWLPPYCKKCSMVGHNCGALAGVRDKPRVT